MKFGMPSLVEAPDIRDCFRIAQQLGLDFIELHMDLPQHLPDRIDVHLAKQLIHDSGLFLTFHLLENFNPCDFNVGVRAAYLEIAKRAIEVALELRCPIVNLHMPNGVYFSLPDKKVYLFEQYKHDFLENLLRFRALCDAMIGDANLSICVENCGGFLPFQKDGLDMLLQSDHFGLTFDVGHDHYLHADEAYIRAHVDRLKHMHLHDAIDTRNHLTLGTGEMDIQDKLALAAVCDATIVLETKTIEALQTSVCFLQTL